MILFTGDLFLGCEIRIHDRVKEIIGRSDFIVSNFENVIEIEDAIKRHDKSSILTTSIEKISNYVEQTRTDHIFCIGNNHINDLGDEGIMQTKTCLDGYSNIKYLGAGNEEEVIKPLIIDYGVKKIAFLSLSTDNPEVMAIVANKQNYGVLDICDPRVVEIIRETKKTVDYFVIMPHWGLEYVSYPAYSLRKKAYAWIDAGADLIVGHHAHIIQGKELYKGKWIYYSLGNYIFPEFYLKNDILHKWNKKNCYSIALKVRFINRIEIGEIGLYFNTSLNLLELDETSLNLLTEVSKPLNYGKVTKKLYYSIWENEVYQMLKQRRSIIRIVKGRFLFKHRNKNFISYYFYKFIAKFKFDD